MQIISKETALLDLRRVFDIGSGLSEVRGDIFYIYRGEYTYEDVCSMLKAYFSVRSLEPGLSLVVSPVLYLFTEFYFKTQS